MVLNTLSQAPFKPVDGTDLKLLSSQAALLLAVLVSFTLCQLIAPVCSSLWITQG